VAEALNRPGADLQLIFLCGRHDESAARIRAMRKQIPMWVEGFTQEVPYYMALSDFLIGKPGPGSISEALATRLPVIVERNRKTLAHERYNAEWIQEQRVGLVTGSFDRVYAKVEELLRPEIYRRCRANAEGLRNRAVFEAVDWLEYVLRESGRLRSRTA
jgi:UDP-N-acetylglucosamine:LPS N-acetylglucosamine transferase